MGLSDGPVLMDAASWIDDHGDNSCSVETKCHTLEISFYVSLVKTLSGCVMIAT